MSVSKTGIFNLLLVVVGALQTFDWAQIIPAQYAGAAVSVIGLVGLFLRSVTTGPATAGLVKPADPAK